SAVRFSPDGTRVLSTAWYKPAAAIWDVARATRLHELPQTTPVRCGEWTADGKLLVATSDSLRIYQSDRLRTALSIPQKPASTFGKDDVTCGDVSPDGRLAVASTRHGAYLFDLATGNVREVGDWKPELAFGGYNQVVFSPDGRWLLGATKSD